VDAPKAATIAESPTQVPGGAEPAAPSSGTQPLYRAVRPPELANLEGRGVFRNPDGVEVKYFSTTESGAHQYRAMAERAFKDGPYVVVETEIPLNAITPEMQVTVDGGIETVTVPTDKLRLLAPPVVKK
jgi:hypothetical protein